MHFLAQPHTKKLDIDELFGKLSAYQGLQKRKEELVQEVKVNGKSLGLKVDSLEDDEDYSIDVEVDVTATDISDSLTDLYCLFLFV